MDALAHRRHIEKGLQILNISPSVFGFLHLGRGIVFNEDSEARVRDFALGLTMGLSDKVAAEKKKAALVELLQTYQYGFHD